MGLGANDGSSNPFATARTPFLRDLLGGPLTLDLEERGDRVVLRHLDATLDHPGLPQSATGQATLLTGSNCATAMGRHYGPWPGPTIKRVLDRGTLFSEVQEAGKRPLLANAYPPGYFTALREGRARMNVPAYAAQACGLPLADLSDYASGRAIAADLTGEHFASLESGLPVTPPETAGARLADLSAQFDFTFFDFWLSDRTGHRGSWDQAVDLVETLDRFIAGVFGAAGPVTVLITSDHGNLEDKSTRGHTRAPVPLMSVGPGSGSFRACGSLLDVAPAVRSALGLDPSVAVS